MNKEGRPVKSAARGSRKHTNLWLVEGAAVVTRVMRRWSVSWGYPQVTGRRGDLKDGGWFKKFQLKGLFSLPQLHPQTLIFLQFILMIEQPPLSGAQLGKIHIIGLIKTSATWIKKRGVFFKNLT